MVDRCVCFNRFFSEMQQVMIHNNIKTFEELKKYITFGENCSLCVPYVELMIKTGRTEFEYTEVTGDSN
jgi:bacterioferritin-associated ferredoxin